MSPSRDRRALAAASATVLLVAMQPFLPAWAADPQPVAAESLLVGPASGRGLSAAIVARAHAVLVVDLTAQCPSCLVVDRGGQPQSMPLDGARASASLAQSQANILLTLDVQHGGDSTRFTLAIFRRAPDGSVGDPEALAETTRGGPEALDVVIHALVIRLFQRFGDWSPTFAASARRAVFFRGSVGGMGQFNIAGDRNGYRYRMIPALSLAILHSGVTSLFDGRVEYGVADGAERTAAGFAYAVRLLRRWSLGAAATWVWMDMGGRGASGVAVEPMIGCLIGSADAPRLHIEAGYIFNLFKEQEMDRLIPGSDAKHWSHGPQFWLGVVL